MLNLERRPSSPISGAPLVFLDLETSGLYPERGARIREIALVSDHGTLVDWKDPGDDGSAARQIEGVLDAIRTSIVVGHNVRFDLAFVTDAVRRHQLSTCDIYFIDTLALAIKQIPDLTTYSLETLVELLEIPVSGRPHTALVDAESCRQLFHRVVAMGRLRSLAEVGLTRMRWQDM